MCWTLVQWQPAIEVTPGISWKSSGHCFNAEKQFSWGYFSAILIKILTKWLAHALPNCIKISDFCNKQVMDSGLLMKREQCSLHKAKDSRWDQGAYIAYTQQPSISKAVTQLIHRIIECPSWKEYTMIIKSTSNLGEEADSHLAATSFHILAENCQFSSELSLLQTK